MIKDTINSKKFNFSDFTIDHYKEILTLAKQTHVFSSYSDFDKHKNILLNRHDVDFSIENALVLGKLENKMGVISTYFFMLHSEYYGLLEKKSIEILKELKALGHNIGLHFDAQFYNIKNEKELDTKIRYEKEVIEYFADVEVEVFSFHNTTDFSMNCREWKYGGLINTYADLFQSEIAYCSDSNGYWRFHRMIDFITENRNKPIQLLTHPVWWTTKIQSPKVKIEACIEERAVSNKEEYEHVLKFFNRENLDW